MEHLASVHVRRPTVLTMCPGYNLLAAAMAARGDDVGKGSRIEVVKLCIGDEEQAVGCTMELVAYIPSSACYGNFHRLAWSEPHAHPLGLIAGGLDGGRICIWDPSKLRVSNEVTHMSGSEDGLDSCPSTLCQIVSRNFASLVAKRPLKEMQIRHSDIHDAQKAISDMDTKIALLIHEHSRKQGTSDEEAILVNPCEDVISIDSELDGWVEVKGVHLDDESSEFPLMLNNLTGPVLGLAFNNKHPSLLAGAAYGNRLSIYHLDRAFGNSDTPYELTSRESTKVHAQMTYLEWHPCYPSILASTSDAGDTNIWDLREKPPKSTFSGSDALRDSEVHWCPMEPLVFAVSFKDRVKIWDVRNRYKTLHEFVNIKGVTSFSWCASGQIVTVSADGSVDSWKSSVGSDKTMVRPLCASGVHEARCLSDDMIAASSSDSINMYKIPKDGCIWLRNE